MNETEARSWIGQRNVPRETLDTLERFLAFLREQAESQNLISASTMDHMWARHVVDSAQLLDHVQPWSNWLDLGSGAGFPGLIIAILTDKPVSLIESRAKRIEYLREAAIVAGVQNRVRIIGGRVETAPGGTYDVISARAFAPLPKLLDIAHRFAVPATQWLLPKGRSAAEEVAEISGSWHGDFSLVPSITDAGASIILARNVDRRKGR